MTLQSGSRVVLDTGRRIALGKLVKSGGAGSVYLLPDDPDRVAKIYHHHVDHTVYERKLQAMLRLSPDLPDRIENGERLVQVAWPSSLARDERGRFAGFLMPKLDIQATIELEYMLQERQARAAGLPTGLGARVTLAANLSAVLAELHRQRHYVVDLKPVNVRFYRRSLNLAMLDCDGFSIHAPDARFPAQQYTPEYLAPEFHARGIEVGGEEQQDRFALAVIVFQLLNFGIHPYTGRPDSDAVPTDIPGRIAGRWYAYGLQDNKRFKPNPGSGHEQMPLELRLLFDRAFASAGETRPSPSEWVSALKPHALRSAGRLTICARDPAHQHFASLACAACMRDALLQGARAVPHRQPPAPRSVAAPPPLPHRKKRGKRRKGGGAAPQVHPSTPLPIAGATFGALPPAPRATQAQPAGGAWPAWVLSVVMCFFVAALLFPIVRSPPRNTAPSLPTKTTPVVAPEQVARTGVLLAAASGHLASYHEHMEEMKVLADRAASRYDIDRSAARDAKRLYRELAFDTQARGRPGYGEASMRLLERAHRSNPTDAGIASELGFMQLLHFGLDENAHLPADPGAGEVLVELPRISTVFERAVAADPEDAGHWYGLALSYVDRPDARLAMGAFAISELLAANGERLDIGRSRLRFTERSLGTARKARLDTLKARGRVAASALGLPPPPEEVQHLGAQALPPVPTSPPAAP